MTANGTKIENVTITVTTTETTHDYPANEPLKAAVQRALGETHQQDHDLSSWILETEDGTGLDLEQTFKQASISAGSRLRLRRRKPGIAA